MGICKRRLFTEAYLFYTDEEEVVGLCGLHKDYETVGKDSTRKMYPWMASIEVQVNVAADCRSDPRLTFLCATLITPFFLL